MNRLLVFLLAAFDAAIAVAVGLVAVFAPLTLLWVFGASGGEDWAALWPVAARIWQFGHLVPVDVTLPTEYLTATGISADAASFQISLAPLAFAAFTAIFAARSGARAARAGAWVSGVVAGGAVVAVAATLIFLTTGLSVAVVDPVAAIALPTAVFVVPALIGAVVGAWRVGDDGIVDEMHVAIHRHPLWAGVPAAAAAGTAIVAVGLLGVGALVLVVSLVAHAGEVVALYEAANVDLVGVIVFSVAQLAYLPTLVVWGASFAAGPGFAVGVGTAVSPSGTSLGVVPGIPVFGALPQDPSSWLLLLALAVVALGALAGRSARMRMLAHEFADEPMLPRAVAAAAIAALSGGVAALFAVVASGAMGPDRMTEIGPAPGPFALAVAVEVAIGAGIMLLAPRLEERPETYRAPTVDADIDQDRAATGRSVVVAAPIASLFDDHHDDGDTAWSTTEQSSAGESSTGEPTAAASAVPPSSVPGADDETAPLDDVVADARDALAAQAAPQAGDDETEPLDDAVAGARDALDAAAATDDTVPLDEHLAAHDADGPDAAEDGRRPTLD